MKHTRKRVLLAFAATALVALGCAQEREPIVRVQANALKKSFFVGEDLSSKTDDPEFYMRSTMLETGYGLAPFPLTPSWASDVARVKWEISENQLIARLTYERIQDTDHFGSRSTNNGQIVAAYSIEKHFDIRRGYNPNTGEELNIIDENASDRPWFAREYMRVDWSRNLVGEDMWNLDALSQLKVFGDMSFESMAYYVNDPNDADAPVFDPTTGYFDIVGKVYAKPGTVETPFGKVPACLLPADYFNGTEPWGNCWPQELRLRYSFRRLTDTDFEPQDWDGIKFQNAGIFNFAERKGYDQNYQMVDEKWHRFAEVYNIWQGSHRAIPCNTQDTWKTGDGNAHRDLTRPSVSGPEPGPNGTEDECEEAGAGSRCDEFTQKCTIPLRDRVSRTIPLHYGMGSPEDLWSSVAGVVEEWNQIMRKAVHAGRLVECRRTEGVNCDQDFPIDDPDHGITPVPNVFVLCHNPVKQGDDPSCGEEGRTGRLGDLRFNLITIFPQPETASPWGVRMDGADPLTGEKVNASINVWDWVDWVAAQRMVDSMRWLNGELSDQDVINGNYLDEAVRAEQLVGRTKARHASVLSRNEVEKRLDSLGARSVDGQASPLPAFPSEPVLKPGNTQVPLAGNGPAATNASVEARMMAARGSSLDAELTTGPWLQLAGFNGNVTLTDDVVARASPLRAGAAQWRTDTRRQMETALQRKGVCLITGPSESPEPTSLVGLARVMTDKFGPPPSDRVGRQKRIDKMVRYLRKKVMYGVLAHEFGHSVGLRHQFASSADALNFRPQYWQLRTRNGTVTTPCTEAVQDGSQCVGPRWYDPVTDEEVDGLIWLWQSDTVMDYPGDQAQDFLGTGTMDLHSTLAAYAGVVDTWSDPAARCSVPGPGDTTGWGACKESSADGSVADALISRLDTFGGIAGPFTYDVGQSALFSFGNLQDFDKHTLHYSRFGSFFKLLRNCRQVNPDDLRPAGYDEEQDGAYHPTVDGGIVKVDGKYTVCDRPPHDYADWRDMGPSSSSGPSTPGSVSDVGASLQHHVHKSNGQVRWPYLNGSDSWADVGNIAVMRHDSGADAYEQFNFWMSSWEDNHLFSDYRRNRTSFTIRGAVDRSQERYHDKVKNAVQGFALLYELGWSQLAGVEGMIKPSALAATMGFEHFARNVTRPHAGPHHRGKSPLGDVVWKSDEDYDAYSATGLIVPDGTQLLSLPGASYPTIGYGGRAVNNALANDKGEYDVQYLRGVGSYYDKIHAFMNLAESEDRFFSQSLEDFRDPRYRNLSFATIFPEGMRRLLAAVMAGDAALLGPRVAATGDEPQIDTREFIDPSATTRNPDYMKPQQPIGWVQFWPKNGPQVCLPDGVHEICLEFPGEKPVGSSPLETVVVDPQVAFEQQKFAAFFTLLYIPENWKFDWIDLFRIYRVGSDKEPDLPSVHAVHYKDPISGELYIAHSYGTETLLGKTVDRGIAARMLQSANLLLSAAFVTDGPPDPVTGRVDVKYDADGLPVVRGASSCGESDACQKQRGYKALLDWVRQVSATFGFPAPDARGLDFN